MVEDNLINQKIAARILEKLGCAVQVAGDGLIAVELVGSEEFDIIFMDCQMPVMDGFEATARIRRLAKVCLRRTGCRLTAAITALT